MKKFFILLALLLVFPLTYADDDDSGNGRTCQYPGSWFGYDEQGEVNWTSQVLGITFKHGTVLLEVPFPADAFNAYGFNAVGTLSNLKGEWKKIGMNKYYYRAASFAYNAEGKAEWIAKLTGYASVEGEDCDVLFVHDSSLTIYYPDVDPYLTDEAYIFTTGPLPDHYGYRIKNDLP